MTAIYFAAAYAVGFVIELGRLLRHNDRSWQTLLIVVMLAALWPMEWTYRAIAWVYRESRFIFTGKH
jgi:hypothetical protein